MPVKDWWSNRNWFLSLHTILILVWGCINVAYYPTLQNYVLYLWILPSFYAAMYFSPRVYLITLAQETVLSTVVVWQTPSTFFTSIQTVLFVNIIMLMVFEFLYQYRRKIVLLEEQYQHEISIYRHTLTQAKFVPYERDYVTNTFSFIGDTIEELTGYTKDTFTPEYWEHNSEVIKVLGEGKGLSARRAVEEARSGHVTHWIAECMITVNENQHRFLLNSAIELVNQQGESVRSIGFLQDITEQKLSDHLMHSENVVLEQIIANKPLPEIAETLTQLFEEVFPRSLCSLILYNESSNTIHSLSSRSLPEAYVNAIDGFELTSFQGSCGRAIQTKQSVIVTDTYTDPVWSGHHNLAKKFQLKTCWSIPILSAQGKVFGTFAVYFTTSRKPMPEELEYLQRWARIVTIAFESSKRDRKLRENEQWFRSIIEHSSDAVFVYNLDGDIQYASPASLQLTGFEMHEVLGKSFMDFIHPDDLPKAELAFSRMKNNHRLRPQTENLRICHASGQWIYIEAVGRNLLHIPAVNGFIVNARDVTDRKMAEDALRRQEEQLWRSQNLESLGRLTKGISHEFNNLLTKIYGNCEIIRMQSGLPESLQDGLK